MVWLPEGDLSAGIANHGLSLSKIGRIRSMLLGNEWIRLREIFQPLTSCRDLRLRWEQLHKTGKALDSIKSKLEA
jgi:hypothetical protein